MGCWALDADYTNMITKKRMKANFSGGITYTDPVSSIGMGSRYIDLESGSITGIPADLHALAMMITIGI